MTNNIVKILSKIRETTGIETAMYADGGKLVYGEQRGVTYADVQYTGELSQPEGSGYTVLPLAGGTVVVLYGDGEEYRNYALLIRTAADGASEHKHELTLAEKLRMYLLGELSGEATAELNARFAGTFDGYVLTLVTDTKAKAGELKNFLETMKESGDLIVPYDERSLAYIKSCGEDDEYQSATDFAFTLYDNIKEELRIDFVISVGGTVHSFAELASVFRRCALAYEFGKMMSPNGKIYSYKEYMLIKMLSELTHESLQMYLDTLLDKDSAEILDDEELMTTAEEFLKNSLNISETSRGMYMHRNTLIYRLDKIEKSTGLNLRHFNDAVAFRLLTVLDKLVKNK